MKYTQKEKREILLELVSHDIQGNMVVVKTISIRQPFSDKYRLFIDRELRREIVKEVRKITKEEIERWL